MDRAAESKASPNIVLPFFYHSSGQTVNEF
jgi:hypothetical protein